MQTSEMWCTGLYCSLCNLSWFLIFFFFFLLLKPVKCGHTRAYSGAALHSLVSVFVRKQPSFCAFQEYIWLGQHAEMTKPAFLICKLSKIPMFCFILHCWELKRNTLNRHFFLSFFFLHWSEIPKPDIILPRGCIWSTSKSHCLC